MKVKTSQLDSAVEFLASFGRAVQIESVPPCSLFKSERSGIKKSLKSHRIVKITTQQARTHHVNKVRRFLLTISANTYLLESITWIPIQILY